MTASSEGPRVRRLILTRQFAASYDRMTPFAVRHLEESLKRLLTSPGGPGVRLRRLVFPSGYHVLRFGHKDRALLRIEGPLAILLDVLSFVEVARLDARTCRSLRLSPPE